MGTSVLRGNGFSMPSAGNTTDVAHVSSLVRRKISERAEPKTTRLGWNPLRATSTRVAGRSGSRALPTIGVALRGSAGPVVGAAFRLSQARLSVTATHPIRAALNDNPRARRCQNPRIAWRNIVICAFSMQRL
jgi:hypothetical protein